MNNISDRDPSYAWVMVACVFILSALSFGTLASLSVFLKPLSLEFGWSRGQASFGYTVISFASALFGVFWGYIADKYGTRWFGIVAALAMSLSLFLLSKQTSIYHFYGFYFLFGAFGNAMVTAPLFANVGFWFRKNPGLALGITAAGGAVGQGLIPYYSGVIIETDGWQAAYYFMAIIYLAIAIPAALFIRESPWREQARTSLVEEPRDFPLSEKEAITWLCSAVIFCCICMSVPIVHLVPLLTDTEFSMEFATSVLMVLMFCGAFGRILGGKLGDMIGALPAYILMSLGQAISVIWFPYITDPMGLYLLAAFFGFTYSGVMSSILVCTRMMVSAKFAGRANSIGSFFGWLGMGMGGFFGGYFFDLYGDYFWSFAFASIMGGINLLVLLRFLARINSRKVVTE
ncbi:MAG: MFS transporter [SAR86 cluster bacterium]|jgi:MFS family permease|nr:MFS transporter [SAR86 cluster bacterium]